MKPVCISGATHVFGEPKDWDAATQGPCGALHVREVIDPDIGPELRSAWQPDADELAILNAGGVVILNVVGDGHPPVALWAEPSPASPVTPPAL